MLLFKKKFLEAIRSGEKTQTVRFAKHCRFRAGQRSFIPGAGYVRIVSIEQTSLEALSDEDAKPDGFATADMLRNELKTLYPDRMGEEWRVFKISFRLLPAEEQARILAERESRKRSGLEKTQEAHAVWFEETMKKIGDLAKPGRKPHRSRKHRPAK